LNLQEFDAVENFGLQDLSVLEEAALILSQRILNFCLEVFP
jgi:hypothetical protein